MARDLLICHDEQHRIRVGLAESVSYFIQKQSLHGCFTRAKDLPARRFKLVQISVFAISTAAAPRVGHQASYFPVQFGFHSRDLRCSRVSSITLPRAACRTTPLSLTAAGTMTLPRGAGTTGRGGRSNHRLRMGAKL
jgi:hypothetical protein